jgi:hypothetical protein
MNGKHARLKMEAAPVYKVLLFVRSVVMDVGKWQGQRTASPVQKSSKCLSRPCRIVFVHPRGPQLRGTLKII